MPPSETLSRSRALALGLLQGPAELLPVSSSSHTALLPALLRWPAGALPLTDRRTFEVALHGASALGLLTQSRALAARTPPRALLPALLLPAAAGYALEDRIDRAHGGELPIAWGLLAGAAAMVAVQLRAPSSARRQRRISEAGVRDGLALGVAQALALAPGVSRHGAVLSVAAARGFAPIEAGALSWTVGLPVIAGATLLKARRLLKARATPIAAPALAAGAIGAFGSAALCARARIGRGAAGNLIPYAVYRGLLGAGVLLRSSRASASAQRRSSSPA
ncbi:MAG TPA: undecaprenyl-diphosphate phosphatase [Solirubrobacteraceae bacterium]|nr:undecaprenyl-diphosphate phosphatase [Solirubrobacteraceae bacterium]